mgnify:CR=1 FL=1
MTISKEAIEAAVTKAMGWQPSETGPGYQQTRDEVLAILSTLPIAVEGKVKALEWQELNERNFKASTIIGEYHIQGVEANVNFRLYLDGDEMRPKEGYYRPLDDAKAAAQSDFETHIFSALISSPGKDGGQEVEAVELSGVADQIAEGSGFWRSCSGCHNLNEGVPTGPYSSLMKCHLGFGCRECGGVGAIWDNVDYSDFGLHEINEAQP